MQRLPIALLLTLILGTLTSAQDKTPVQPRISDQNIVVRGDFQNSRLTFERKRKGHVAFIGGSITEMNGYRPMVMEVLKKRFPDTEFHFTAAGISSTCSTTGAFRLKEHVLEHGPVDLFFVEFAVNDDQDAAHAYREALRGMEGIVRHTRLHNPKADIVLTYFVNPGMLETWQSNETPLSVKAHEQVAQHYKIPAINLARQVAQSITAGDLTWKLFGGTHPKPFGNRIAARMIDRLMDVSWQGSASGEIKDHTLPEPIDSASYFRGRMLDIQSAELSGGAVNKRPLWKEIKGGFRDRFAEDDLCCLETPDAKVKLEFTGTAVGAYVLAGPDAGILSVQIDDMPAKSIDLYHRFSKGLHYPRTVMFDTDLNPGEHTLTVRLDSQSPTDRQAARILKFVAN